MISLGRLVWVLVMVALAACGASTGPIASTPANDTAPTQIPSPQVAVTASTSRPAPVGWKVYRGTRVPFVMAYPADWSVDEESASVGEISFMRDAKKGSIEGTIATRSSPDRAVNLAVLRGRFVNFITRVCEKGRTLERTGQAVFSRLTFATATAKCASEEEEAGEHEVTFYVGVALRHGVEWTFSFRCDGHDFAANRHTYFTPMLETLNIYANP